MKLENLANLYFVIAVFVPGFIYSGVLSRFVTLREQRAKETIFLQYLVATSVNYGVCSPAIYLLVVENWLWDRPVCRAMIWAAIIFLVPILIALVSAKITQQDGLKWLYKLLGLRPINPIPTGWDWIFSRDEPCFVLVTLKDRTEIAGYFGPKSLASSDPDRRDLYLEAVYTIPEDGPWQLVERSKGVYIAGADISMVECKGSNDDDRKQ
jgi:hypothetical protein